MSECSFLFVLRSSTTHSRLSKSVQNLGHICPGHQKTTVFIGGSPGDTRGVDVRIHAVSLGCGAMSRTDQSARLS